MEDKIEEKKAYNREYMNRRYKEDPIFRDKMKSQYKNKREQMLSYIKKYQKKWRKEHRLEHNKKNRDFRNKWAGISEKEISKKFIIEHPTFYSLDNVTPDFYDKKIGFIEIKRALPYKKASWTQKSKYFPTLYFFKKGDYEKVKTRTVDNQIEAYPRPLTIYIFHGLSGEFLTELSLS